MRQGDEIKVNANPTKEFFIKMLTRDIELEPAIVELVDNSLDGAKAFMKENDGQIDMLSIDIKFDENEFSISDNCGGISIKEAQDYVFRFGRVSERPESEKQSKSIGVFGIGMKRALFKLGNNFAVESTTLDEHFKIEVDVEKWLQEKDTDWSFSFAEANSDLENSIEKCGTSIRVSNLFDPIKNKFAEPSFQQHLIDYIKQRNTMMNDLKVKVFVNGVELNSFDDNILFNDDFQPLVKIINLDSVKTTVVSACAIPGFPQKAGWSIFCNGRLIVSSDQSSDTGWGTDNVPLFHVAFATFRGYVFFESNKLEKLPWNTSKTGVDYASKYYVLALHSMKEAVSKYIKYRNEVERYITSHDDVAYQTKDIFKGDVISIGSRDFIDYIKSNHNYITRSLDNMPAPEVLKTTVAFKKEVAKVERVKEHLGVKNKSKMGEQIFDYYYEREIEDNE